MPFTFAHPALAIPLARPLRRWGSLPALIIGSMTPDFWYFLPVDETRPQTHSLSALFSFCLPWGLVVYWVAYFVWLKPCVSLVEPYLGARAAALRRWARKKPFWPSVPLSLLIGALTHIVWDSFTHNDGWAVWRLHWLLRKVCTIKGHPLFGFDVLQIVTTAIGLVFVAVWFYRRVKRLPKSAAPLDDSWPIAGISRGWIIALCCSPPIVLMLTMLPALSHGSVAGLHLFARRVVVYSISGVSLVLLLFSVYWWIAAFNRRDGNEHR